MTFSSAQVMRSVQSSIIYSIVYGCYKAGNSGEISYLMSSLAMIHDIIMTSLSVYVLTVPVNLVYIKLWV